MAWDLSPEQSRGVHGIHVLSLCQLIRKACSSKLLHKQSLYKKIKTCFQASYGICWCFPMADLKRSVILSPRSNSFHPHPAPVKALAAPCEASAGPERHNSLCCGHSTSTSDEHTDVPRGYVTCPALGHKTDVQGWTCLAPLPRLCVRSQSVRNCSRGLCMQTLGLEAGAASPRMCLSM